MTDFEYLRNANILFELATATETGLSSLEKKVQSRASKNYFGETVIEEGAEISWTEENLLSFCDELKVALVDFGVDDPQLSSLLPASFDEALRDYLAIGTYVAMMHFSTAFYYYKYQTGGLRDLNVYAMDRCLKTMASYPLRLSTLVQNPEWTDQLQRFHSLMKEVYKSPLIPEFERNWSKEEL